MSSMKSIFFILLSLIAALSCVKACAPGESLFPIKLMKTKKDFEGWADAAFVVMEVPSMSVLHKGTFQGKGVVDSKSLCLKSNGNYAFAITASNELRNSGVEIGAEICGSNYVHGGSFVTIAHTANGCSVTSTKSHENKLMDADVSMSMSMSMSMSSPVAGNTAAPSPAPSTRAPTRSPTRSPTREPTAAIALTTVTYTLSFGLKGKGVADITPQVKDGIEEYVADSQGITDPSVTVDVNVTSVTAVTNLRRIHIDANGVQIVTTTILTSTNPGLGSIVTAAMTALAAAISNPSTLVAALNSVGLTVNAADISGLELSSPIFTGGLAPTLSPTAAEDASSGLSQGAIIGIAVGVGGGGLIIIAFLIWYCYCRKPYAPVADK